MQPKVEILSEEAGVAWQGDSDEEREAKRAKVEKDILRCEVCGCSPQVSRLAQRTKATHLL